MCVDVESYISMHELAHTKKLAAFRSASLIEADMLKYVGLSLNISCTTLDTRTQAHARAHVLSVLSENFCINDTMNLFAIHTGRLSILLNCSDADVSQIGKVQRPIRRHR